MWDGKTFNFVARVSTGRNEAVRAMAWSRSGDYLLTGDGGGVVGYYEPTVKPLAALESHKKAIRGLSFAPTDSKFVTCSDDSTLAIWDFATRKNEAVLEGHNWDVRCVDWHPYNSVIVSGAKDKLIKLWDSKSKTNIHTWQGHKGDVSKVTWNANGNWFLSASRDYSMRIFDIRMMKELQVIRGNGEMCSVSWHPFHEKLFSSGDANGDITFWIAGQDAPQGRIYGAHSSAIWDMKWHPFGHLLCASGNDSYTSFWCRNRPGEKMEDRFNDPTYVAPSRSEQDAHAHAQAAINAMQSTAATVAALSAGEIPSSDAPSVVASHSEDFAASQKHHIVPGAVGSAGTNEWLSLLSSGSADFGEEDRSLKRAAARASAASPAIPGLGQVSSNTSLRGSGMLSSAGSGGGSGSQGRRLDTRRDDRRNDDRDIRRDRYDGNDRNDKPRSNDYRGPNGGSNGSQGSSGSGYSKYPPSSSSSGSYSSSQGQSNTGYPPSSGGGGYPPHGPFNQGPPPPFGGPGMVPPPGFFGMPPPFAGMPPQGPPGFMPPGPGGFTGSNLPPSGIPPPNNYPR